MRWTLFDYGVGNLHSLRKALEQHAGIDVTEDARRLADADAIVLPGVGAFAPVMASLAPAVEALREHHAAGRPMLGVCIGMQVLYEASDEAPGTPGLGLVPGRVVHLGPDAGKIPHMGWNTLETRAGGHPAGADEAGAAGALEDALAAAGHVYYVHSYAAPPGPSTLATTTYGAPFAAAARTGNTIGFQFHPEKSSAAGKAILGAALRTLEDA